MLTSGLPEKTHLHAKNIALVALDMIDIARDIVLEGDLHVRVNASYHIQCTTTRDLPLSMVADSGVGYFPKR